MNSLRALALACSLLLFPALPALAAEGGQYGRDVTFSESTGSPVGGLALGNDGFFYGVGSYYSIFNAPGKGSIYRYRPGESPEVVHVFGIYTDPDGGDPLRKLTLMPDGSFWGITFSGGEHLQGSVYRFDPLSGAFETIHSFDYYEGTSPFGGLLLASDGYVYGTTTNAGSFAGGSIFRIDPSTHAFEVLWAFGSRGKYGRSPAAGLTEGPDGRLYGVTNHGIDSSVSGGSLFAFDVARRAMSLVFQFSASVGDNEQPVTFASDGMIYGVTQGRLYSRNCGSVYSVRPNGRQFRVLHVFDCSHGAYPYGPLLFASDGYLYGSVYVNGPLYRIRPGGGSESFSILKSAHGTAHDHGQDFPRQVFPFDELLEIDGVIHSIAEEGGANDDGFVFTLRSDNR